MMYFMFYASCDGCSKSHYVQRIGSEGKFELGQLYRTITNIKPRGTFNLWDLQRGLNIGFLKFQLQNRIRISAIV